MTKHDCLASGLTAGDEILVINGKVVSELDMVYVETLLQDSHCVTLTVRSLKTPPAGATIEAPVTCPPPPSQARLSDNSIGNLKIPPPSGNVLVTLRKYARAIYRFLKL